MFASISSMMNSSLLFCRPSRARSGSRWRSVGERMRSVSACSQTLGDDLLVEMLADQVQHHVERGGAPGAGVAIAVDLEEVGIDLRLGKALGEGGERFPMDGAAAAVEDAGVGEHPGPVSSAPMPIFCRSSEAIQAFRLRSWKRSTPSEPQMKTWSGRSPPRTFFARVLQRHVDIETDAVRRGGRKAVERDERPAIRLLPRHAIGDAEGLDRHGEGDHGEVRQEHEIELPLAHGRGLGDRRRLYPVPLRGMSQLEHLTHRKNASASRAQCQVGR